MDKFVIRTVNAIYTKIANFRISPPDFKFILYSENIRSDLSS